MARITLINIIDGSVEGHIAGCADIKRRKSRHADTPWTFSVDSKEEARAEYNADFDKETDGWYDIDWLPCARFVPEHDDDRLLVVCRQCGLPFEVLAEAVGHAGTCGSDQGFDVMMASELQS